METRKIQQVGGGTYTVSLPKEWADEVDIEPGSTVALHTHIDGTLVVQTGSESGETATPLSLSIGAADPECIAHTLRAAYTAGIDTVELSAKEGLTDHQRRKVERITRDLTGMTVTESNDERMRVRSLLDSNEVSIPQSVRQLQFTALSAHRDATAAVTGPTSVEDPATRDNQPDRLYSMVNRYFQQGLDSLSVMDALGLTQSNLFIHWVTARELERVADHARRIADVANRLEAPLSGELAEEFNQLSSRTRTVVRKAVGSIVDSADTATLRILNKECSRLHEALNALDRRLFEMDDAPYRLTNALDALVRTVDSAESIAMLALRSRLRGHTPDDEALTIGDVAESLADT